MKFASLFKKEIRELLNRQTIISLVFTLIIFYSLGTLMGGVMDEATKDATSITVCNQDNSDFTNSVLTSIEKSGTKINKVELKSDDLAAELKRLGIKDVIIIPEGFSKTVITDKKMADIKIVSALSSMAMTANISSSVSSAGITVIENAVKSTLISEKFSASEATLIDKPLNVVSTTVVADKSADVSTNQLSGFLSMQGTFVPIVIFLLLMYASQMIISAISTEKIDKTLETLLSAPVSRLSVLASKMLAAGTVAALNAVVYMFGFSKFMGGITGSSGSTDSTVTNAVNKLGLSLGALDYFKLGAQMFLTILIALSISLVLGALAKDVKSAQTLTMPIMFSAMIPYFISMFIDISTLPIVFRTLVYAIPFTHTFSAVDNIIFHKDALFYGGLIYQIIFLIVCMYFAVRVFMTDKLFTISLSIGQKRSFNKSFKLLKLFKK